MILSDEVLGDDSDHGDKVPDIADHDQEMMEAKADEPSNDKVMTLYRDEIRIKGASFSRHQEPLY